jgi:hypothetical protein
MPTCTACKDREAVPVTFVDKPTVDHLCPECYTEYEKFTKPTVCETCNVRESIGVCSVPGVPYSAAYCQECLTADAHPWHALVANTACVGGLENSAIWWQEIVNHTLKHLGRTLEEFNADVDKLNADINAVQSAAQIKGE